MFHHEQLIKSITLIKIRILLPRRIICPHISWLYSSILDMFSSILCCFSLFHMTVLADTTVACLLNLPCKNLTLSMETTVWMLYLCLFPLAGRPWYFWYLGYLSVSITIIKIKATNMTSWRFCPKLTLSITWLER